VSQHDATSIHQRLSFANDVTGTVAGVAQIKVLLKDEKFLLGLHPSSRLVRR
jgi:hypothetical protein